MGVKIIKDATLQGIADAIRSKTGTTEPIKTDEMADVIRQISNGGSENVSVEIITLASGFSLANEAKDILTPAIEAEATTLFLRKTPTVPNNGLLFGIFNVLGNSEFTTWLRTRDGVANGYPNAWSSTYALVGEAGDEYYKVVFNE